MSRHARRASLLTAAVLLVQAAWILSVPPFRGIDEFDHAYRAAAVAHGQLLPFDTPAAEVHGDYVAAPESLVAAARPVCESYDYTGPANCAGVGRTDDGQVVVASGAARYNPIFYWVVGTPASMFSGAANVYATRVVAALLCAALVGAAGYALSVGFRSGWPMLGAAVALTPEVLYTSSLGAPNGVEMVAGLAVWSAVLALRREHRSARTETALLAVAGVAASVLVTTRLLGPGWLVLVLGCALPVVGRRRLVEVARRHRRTCAAVVGTVAAATGAALLWTWAARPNSLTDERDLGLDSPLLHALGDIPLWVLQSIAAFPTRSEPAPAVVYAAALSALVAVVLMAGRWMPRTGWLALLAVLALWLGSQVAVTVATYSQAGALWQGRYALPFAVGVPLLVTAWADRGRPSEPPPLLVAGTVVALVVAETFSILHVLERELGSSPHAGSPAWATVPAPVLVALLVASGVLLWWGLRLAPRQGDTAALVEPPAAQVHAA